MNLSNLQPAEGSTHNQNKRLGRGEGSGKGGTSARGHKGAKSRSGYSKKIGFEGGQMPLYRRLPKRGFTNIFALTYAEINLQTIQQALDAGKLDASKPITEDLLVQNGVVRRKLDGIKLLGKGELKTKINLSITKATKSALEVVSKLGGTVELSQK